MPEKLDEILTLESPHKANFDFYKIFVQKYACYTVNMHTFVAIAIAIAIA